MSKLNNYIEGISNNDYHADKDFISSSQLKYAEKSHAEFRYRMNKPYDPGKWDENNAMSFGSYLHSLCSEPHLIEKEYAFMDCEGRNWRTKEDRTYKAKFLEHYSDKIVLPDHARARGDKCMASAMAHPFMKSIIEGEGDVEFSGYYHDDFYGIDIRFRPDKKMIINGKPAIVDFKSIYNIEQFEKSAKWERSYDLSAALYLEGHKVITGEDADFWFPVIESQPPFRVAVYKASEKFLDMGKRKLVKAKTNVNIARKNTNKHILFQEVDFQEI